jgi:hypothetical protein
VRRKVAEERRLANFLDFIGEGRGSQALAKALAEPSAGSTRWRCWNRRLAKTARKVVRMLCDGGGGGNRNRRKKRQKSRKSRTYRPKAGREQGATGERKPPRDRD